MTPIQTAYFWSRVKVGLPYECWNWRGAKNVKGYGHMVIDGQKTMAHRIAHELVNGPISEEFIVRHTCDNPACCNPKHLILGSHQDNMQDMVARGRAAYGVRNGKTKLTAEQASYIKYNPDRLSYKQLSAKFGLASSTISYIRNGRSWKYLE